ncbi:MAG: hypothetical protein NT062_19815, partial [Proteobacteria bacterium]|nr:hypothetical protein [Pseudomonadota bacterium]
DGISAISAAGAGFVIAGFFSGTLPLDVVAPAPSMLTAAGGDDAFVLAFDPVRARVTRVWHATGDGREEITALAPISGGFVAGVAHTAAARFDGAALPAPADPLAGAAVVVR